MTQRIFIVAGEASGDAHAGRVIKALKALSPDIQVQGIGGEQLRQAGVDIKHDFSELAVMGLVEVIKRYPAIKAIYNDTVKMLAQSPPDLLVLVDYPGFNLKLAKAAKKMGIRVLYFISPKVWAWRAGRIKDIQATVDHMAVLFPFEETLYQQHHVPVTCVGHPLVDAVTCDLTPEQAKKKFGLSAEYPVLGLFPGSRKSEISVLLPVMLAATEQLLQTQPHLQIVLPQAPGIESTYLNSLLQSSPIPVPVKVIEGDFYPLIRSCDAVVAASGTVTLEIALCGTPHLIIYKVAPLSYFILKKLVKIPYVGLCNIVTQRNIVTELIQDKANAQSIAAHLTTFLTEPTARQSAESVRQQVLTALGPSGAADNTAKLIVSLLND